MECTLLELMLQVMDVLLLLFKLAPELENGRVHGPTMISVLLLLLVYTSQTASQFSQLLVYTANQLVRRCMLQFRVIPPRMFRDVQGLYAVTVASLVEVVNMIPSGVGR